MLPLLSLLFLLACGRGPKIVQSDFAAFTDQISAFTSGVVASNSTIKVRLAKNHPAAEVGKSLEEKPFRFIPSLEGSTTWEDERTVVFTPKQRLKNDQIYQATFLLGELLEVEADKREFNFSFQTLPQNYELRLAGMEVFDPKDLSRVRLSGVVLTADYTDEEDIEKMLSAEQPGQTLRLSWQHRPGKNE
ncbi:MAG: hypothetical protein HC842_00070, partial [Cytophagales bacterium]|nr:hypothetical protein [Cytophagales bacterium]